VDAWLLALDRNRLRVGIWQLGYAAASNCRMGSGSVGAQTAGLGVDPGPLAIDKRRNGETASRGWQALATS
jgi:hypothetical protein